MEALIVILKNKKAGTFHPVYYIEESLPGNMDSDMALTQFKTKGFHVVGFSSRDSAVEFIESELIEYVKTEFVKTGALTLEIEEKNDVFWDGGFFPNDIQMRPRKKPAFPEPNKN